MGCGGRGAAAAYFLRNFRGKWDPRTRRAYYGALSYIYRSHFSRSHHTYSGTALGRPACQLFYNHPHSYSRAPWALSPSCILIEYHICSPYFIVYIRALGHG